MPASIGVNLRVTGHCRQGGRKYMEDFFSVAYQQTEDERDLEYAFFGIYDGHGGAEAAAYAKEHLMEAIIKHRYFWSDNDEDVLRAIKDGYIATHYNMWKEQEKWPKTTSGLPSTAGTTASIAFIRRGKIYIGHVGDSGIILGYQEPGCSEWKARPLTVDHKPENAEEMSRIEQCGGKVVKKSGVPRVVWNRPRIGHQGPVRRSTPIDEIPFLAVARSLGDLWSYNSQINQFIISPDPDCVVVPIDCNVHRCLIFGTDGLYNMLSPQMAVHIVQQAERHNENAALSDSSNKTWLNPSKLLVEKALERWHSTKMRADNTSVVTLMLDPPGPPRAQVLKNRKKMAYPDSGLKIMTRYEDEKADSSCANCHQNSENDVVEVPSSEAAEAVPTTSNSDPIPSLEELWNMRQFPDPRRSTTSEVVSDSSLPIPSVEEFCENKPTTSRDETPSTSSSVSDNVAVTSSMCPLKERNFVPKTRESTCFESPKPSQDDNSIQIHEISSSSSDIDIVTEEEDAENNSSSSRLATLRSSDSSASNKANTKVSEIASMRQVSRNSENVPVVRTSKRNSDSSRLNARNAENVAPNSTEASVKADSKESENVLSVIMTPKDYENTGLIKAIRDLKNIEERCRLRTLPTECVRIRRIPKIKVNSVPNRVSPRNKKVTPPQNEDGKKAEEIPASLETKLPETSCQVDTGCGQRKRRREITQPDTNCDVLVKKSRRIEAKKSLTKADDSPKESQVSRVHNKPIISRRLSLTQKIVKSKKIMLKKKNLLKKPVTKVKLKLVLDKMKANKTLKRALPLTSRQKQTHIVSKSENNKNRNQKVAGAKQNQRASNVKSQQCVIESTVYKGASENSRLVRPKVYESFVPILRSQRRKLIDSSKMLKLQTRNRRDVQQKQSVVLEQRTRHTRNNPGRRN